MWMRRAICAALLAALYPGIAGAQSVLAELQDAGAKKVERAELMLLLADASLSGTSFAGSEVQLNYRADGTFSGNAYRTLGGTTGLFGTWTVDETGKLCADITIAASNRKDTQCVFIFKVGEQYFAATSDSDRNAQVRKRTIRK